MIKILFMTSVMGFVGILIGLALALPWAALFSAFLMIAIGVLHASWAAVPALGFWPIFLMVLALRLCFGGRPVNNNTTNNTTK